MWLLRKSHKHINQDTLSEYLDGRLQGGDLERVELRLEECGACRLEMEELQATVAMMRQLPMETPRRSFVMSAPPLESGRARPALFLRAPNWVYAGAASVAALALAVTISIDATGGLSSDPLRQDVESAAMSSAPTLEQPFATPGFTTESPTGTEGDGTAPLSLAAAAPTGGALPSPEAAEAPARDEPLDDPSTAVGGAGTAELAISATGTPSPMAATAAPSRNPEAATIEPPSADSSLATAAYEDSQAREPKSTTVAGDTSNLESETAKALTVAEPTPVPESAPLAFAERDAIGGIPIWWRVMEAVAGVVAVAFLAALLLRWRASRRDPV